MHQGLARVSQQSSMQAGRQGPVQTLHEDLARVSQQISMQRAQQGLMQALHWGFSRVMQRSSMQMVQQGPVQTLHEDLAQVSQQISMPMVQQGPVRPLHRGFARALHEELQLPLWRRPAPLQPHGGGGLRAPVPPVTPLSCKPPPLFQFIMGEGAALSPPPPLPMCSNYSNNSNYC